MALFENHCSGCNKRIDSFALDRQGTLPRVFCGGVCSTLYLNKKRMNTEKTIVPLKTRGLTRGYTTDELTEKMKNAGWNNMEYLTEEIL